MNKLKLIAAIFLPLMFAVFMVVLSVDGIEKAIIAVSCISGVLSFGYFGTLWAIYCIDRWGNHE